VMQLDEMTQQNAALVEQATAASQSMAEQGRMLSDMLARYKVAETEPKATTRQASRAPGQTPKAGVNSPPAAAADRPQGERRGSRRPWTGAAAAPQRAAAEAATGTDSEWKEF
jgi:methyl-accepting chemotaxis protein-1 (serine sensor receptor)